MWRKLSCLKRLKLASVCWRVAAFLPGGEKGFWGFGGGGEKFGGGGGKAGGGRPVGPGFFSGRGDAEAARDDAVGLGLFLCVGVAADDVEPAAAEDVGIADAEHAGDASAAGDAGDVDAVRVDVVAFFHVDDGVDREAHAGADD